MDSFGVGPFFVLTSWISSGLLLHASCLGGFQSPMFLNFFLSKYLVSCRFFSLYWLEYALIFFRGSKVIPYRGQHIVGQTSVVMLFILIVQDCRLVFLILQSSWIVLWFSTCVLVYSRFPVVFWWWSLTGLSWSGIHFSPIKFCYCCCIYYYYSQGGEIKLILLE